MVRCGAVCPRQYASVAFVVEPLLFGPEIVCSCNAAATALGVAVVGVVGSLDVLRHKPLATLRAE